MAAKNKNVKDAEINLLPQEGFSYTTAGRILTWILSTFRFIIIVVEIIVMAAFFSRFWLDAKNSDLDDEMASKKEIIISSKDFEAKYRDVQARLKIYSDIAANEKPLADILDSVRTDTPPEVVVSSMSVNNNNFKIEGESASEAGIQQLLVNLEANKYFKNVTLDNLDEKKDSNVLVFSFSSNLEGGTK